MKSKKFIKVVHPKVASYPFTEATDHEPRFPLCVEEGLKEASPFESDWERVIKAEDVEKVLATKKSVLGELETAKLSAEAREHILLEDRDGLAKENSRLREKNEELKKRLGRMLAISWCE